MSTFDKLLAQIRNNPADVRFDDACRVATRFFGQPRQNRGSHRVWPTPWEGDPAINLQPRKDGRAKAYQVRQLLAAIDRMEAEALTPQHPDE